MRLTTAVITLHRRVDEALAASIQGHGVKVACTRGCSFCCNLRVEVQHPHSDRMPGVRLIGQQG